MQIFKMRMSQYIVHDFKTIGKFLSERSKNKLIKEINIRFQNLKQMPKIYQRIYYEKSTDTDYRRIVHRKYIIIYKIQKNQITILRIVSEKENYLKSRYLKSL